jgi:hypothetical protein
MQSRQDIYYNTDILQNECEDTGMNFIRTDLEKSRYKTGWADCREKWTNYWRHCNTGRPLMSVICRKPDIEPLADGSPVTDSYLEQICQGRYYNLPEALQWKDMEDKYQNAERIVARYRYFCEHHEFLGESYPNLNIDFGPGSLAAYLGCDIGFSPDTVWFIPCLEDWDDVPAFCFDPESKWFKKHLALARECAELVGDDILVNMPDLMENIDTLASLRGTQELMCDLIEDEDTIHARVDQITALYYSYYNAFHDVIQDADGGNSYTVFQVWGPGRTVKLQCDCSAMISAQAFRSYIQPSLIEQAKHADNVLYHLDGKDCIRHLDALMEIDGIDALQWTSGDAGPDGTLPDWDIIYDKAIAAGKSIWVKVYSGGFDDWIRNVDRLVQKYGSHSLYLMFPEMSLTQGKTLIAYAEEHWSDVKGSYCEKLGR